MSKPVGKMPTNTCTRFVCCYFGNIYVWI